MTWEEISKELFEKRTAKRFKLRLSKLGNGMITDTQKREDLYFDKEFLDTTLPKTNEWLNELAEENEQLKKILNELSDMLQFDVENGIKSYPMKLSEYLSNALKELKE